MKTQTLELLLNKKTITELDEAVLNNINGGTSTLFPFLDAMSLLADIF